MIPLLWIIETHPDPTAARPIWAKNAESQSCHRVNTSTKVSLQIVRFEKGFSYRAMRLWSYCFSAQLACIYKFAKEHTIGPRANYICKARSCLRSRYPLAPKLRSCMLLLRSMLLLPEVIISIDHYWALLDVLSSSWSWDGAGNQKVRQRKEEHWLWNSQISVLLLAEKLCEAH
jgi:hypothetical protein